MNVGRLGYLVARLTLALSVGLAIGYTATKAWFDGTTA